MFYMEPTNVLKKYYQSKKDIDIQGKLKMI